MPSARYLLVEGVDGIPVVDPHNPAANPARYLGWRIHGRPVADADHVLEHYDREPQVVMDHPAIRKAINAGDLTKHAEVVAKNHEAARAAFATKPVPAPAKPATIAPAPKER